MEHPGVQYISVDCCDVAYEWLGGSSARPLVFLHGLGDSAIITFRRIALHPILARNSTLLIDLPGFGYSRATDAWSSTTEEQAEIVIAILDRLGIAHASIMGHSMGGSIAIQAASRRPDLASRLILAEPLLKPGQSVLAKAIIGWEEADFVSRGFPMLELAARRQAARGDAAATGFREPLSRANPAILHRAAASLLQERSPTFQEMLEGLPMRRTVLVGEQSRMDWHELGGGGVTLEVVPDAGHSMMNENEEGFAHAVARAVEAG